MTKVTNAIIMAAGMSSRFAPLSYDKPKGLLKVKGEILIERQIEQLKEKNINDIIIVTGYRHKEFEYLSEKYDVSIVYNEDYYRYNNTSSLMLVLDQFKNTYVCSSDNYFEQNLFSEKEDNSYYCVQHADNVKDEFFVEVDQNGIITDINYKSGEYFMIGHAFFDESTSKKFVEIMQKEYNREEVKSMLWEEVYHENIEDLKFKAKVDENKYIHEFDYFEELRSFDDYYINYKDNEILNNIANFFDITVSQISNITELKEGLTNLSFKFDINGNSYVYRHPGEGTENIINRNAELFAQQTASDLGLDETFIYMDKDKGYKISHYLENCSILNYESKEEITLAFKQLKKLHDAKIKSGFDSDLWIKTQEMLPGVSEKVKSEYDNFELLFTRVENIYENTKDFYKEKYLCHCDFFNTNVLFDNGNCYIIDWEYSGNDDPAADIGIFVASSDFSIDEAIELLDIYENDIMPDSKKHHFISYFVIAAYYCFIWSLYQESKGLDVGEMLEIWYNNLLKFIDEV